MISILDITFIGFLAVLLGYCLREYIIRITPFFEITYINQVGKRSDPAELDRNVAERLTGSFYIGELSTGPGDKIQTTSGGIFDRWDRSDDIVRFWPEIKHELSQLLTDTTTQAEYLTKLSTLFQYRYFDRFLISALQQDRIQVPDIPDEQELVRADYNANERGGSYSLFFPDGTIRNFGENLNDINRRKNFKLFINLVRFAQRELLNQVLKELTSIFEKEYGKALHVIDDLKSINDTLRHWAFKVHLANLNSTPLMIQNDCTLEIKNGQDRMLLSSILLIVQDRNDKTEEPDYNETDEPIVLEPKSSLVFGLMTAQNQSEMGLSGSKLSKLYESGKGLCRAMIKVRKAGLLKEQDIKSGFTHFTSTKKRRTLPQRTD